VYDKLIPEEHMTKHKISILMHAADQAVCDYYIRPVVVLPSKTFGSLGGTTRAAKLKRTVDAMNENEKGHVVLELSDDFMASKKIFRRQLARIIKTKELRSKEKKCVWPTIIILDMAGRKFYLFNC
jgi:hypothetical protein